MDAGEVEQDAGAEEAVGGVSLVCGVVGGLAALASGGRQLLAPEPWPQGLQPGRCQVVPRARRAPQPGRRPKATLPGSAHCRRRRWALLRMAAADHQRQAAALCQGSCQSHSGLLQVAAPGSAPEGGWWEVMDLEMVAGGKVQVSQRNCQVGVRAYHVPREHPAMHHGLDPSCLHEWHACCGR